MSGRTCSSPAWHLIWYRSGKLNTSHDETPTRANKRGRKSRENLPFYSRRHSKQELEAVQHHSQLTQLGNITILKEEVKLVERGFHALSRRALLEKTCALLP